MRFEDDGRYDETLLLVVSAVGLALLALFAATPVLRPYYALLMPLTIMLGAGGSWALLRSGRRASGVSGAGLPTPDPSQPPASEGRTRSGGRAR